MKHIFLSAIVMLCATVLSAEIARHDRHVVFDNSITPLGYTSSASDVVAPSTLETRNGQCPVESAHFTSPPNSLRLQWHSAAGGDWRMTLQVPRRYARPFRFEGDTLSFWCFSTFKITPDNSPRLYLKDERDHGTPSVTLVNGQDEIEPGHWVQVKIPFSAFHAAVYRDTDETQFVPQDLVEVSFVQGLDDDRDHTLYLDDLRVIDGGRTDLAPPSVPGHLMVKGYERHFDITWSASQATDLLAYRIYRSKDGEHWIPVGTQKGSRTRYVDFVGPPPQRQFYRVTALDIAGNESAPSETSAVARTRAFADEDLMTMTQEACFHYYWDGAHPAAGLAPEVLPGDENLLAVGGNGFGVMALIVAAERGFAPREQIAQRLLKIVRFLSTADRFHGAWPHFLNGNTGKVVPFFGRYDDGGDLVETAFMIQGLLAARQYFGQANPVESELRTTITRLWEEVDWSWYRQASDSDVLYWHWSPDHGFYIHHPLVGWNETMIVYLLAIASPTHPVPADLYYRGWAGTADLQVNYRRGWSRTKAGDHYINGGTFYGTKLDVGEGAGSDLFFTHFSFMGFDPRHLRDRFTNYFDNNQSIARINYAYCVANPRGFVGYGEDCWGLSAGVNSGGGKPNPRDDNGTISVMGSLASMPYLPKESMAALKHYYRDLGPQLFGCYGFHDGFNQTQNWFDEVYMALNQGPITVMIENYRTGLVWRYFMANPEIKPALQSIGFTIENQSGKK